MLARAALRATTAAATATTTAAKALSTATQDITCRAAVCWEPHQPLQTEEVLVAPPRAGEVRLKVVCNALCHTDLGVISAEDPEALYPSIVGHEASAIVESVGEGVDSVQVGDSVIPCYTPECGEPDCVFCQSEKTNLCPRIRATQGQGVMPDGTSRFTHKATGKSIFHFMGTSTFSEYTVVAEISVAKISDTAHKGCAALFGCGVSTGLGAVWNNCQVEAGASVGVFGLGAVGLAVIQGAKMAGARDIYAVDTNPDKFAMATQLGATHCINPADHAAPVQQVIVEQTGWGLDYTFDATGNTEVMRAALESAHRGWGESCVIGVAAAGHEVSTRPFQLVTGRVWRGTAFGGFKSRTDVPKLVERFESGELPVEHYITHEFHGVDQTNAAIEALHGGDCLRAVVYY